MLLKCCTQYASKLGKLSSGHRTGKSVFIPIPKKGNAKECSNYHTIVLISETSKAMLKTLKVRLQQYVNWKFPDGQAGFRKGRGTRDQIANICWINEKEREFQKNTYVCFIDYTKAFNCVNHNKLWEILKKMWIPDRSSWENLYAGQREQLQLDIKQQTCSKLGKEYVKVVYCHPTYLTYMQSTSWETWLDEAQAGIKIAGRNLNNLRYADDSTLMAESEELKNLLLKVK